jgi:AcrR family transcriptional regulator
VSVNAEPATNRQRIPQAAMTVIETRGEVGLRVDEMGEMAGVTTPSIYQVFAHRDGRISAAQAERYRRDLIQVLGSSVSRHVLRAEIQEVERHAAPDFEQVFQHAWDQGRITTHFSLGIVSRRAHHLRHLTGSMSCLGRRSSSDLSRHAPVGFVGSFLTGHCATCDTLMCPRRRSLARAEGTGSDQRGSSWDGVDLG